MSIPNSAFGPDSPYYSNLRHDLVRLLPASKLGTVLDVGCGAGVCLEWCRSQGARRLIGIELREDLAPLASRIDGVEAIHCGDVSSLDLSQYEGQVDVIIAGFLFEHVPDPWALLRRLRRLLTAQGVLVGSLPNVGHHSISVPLLFRSRWSYAEEGIMDWTHLRFFTKQTIIQLLESTGYRLDIITPEFPGGRRYRIANRLSAKLFEGLLAYAYNFRAGVERA